MGSSVQAWAKLEGWHAQVQREAVLLFPVCAYICSCTLGCHFHWLQAPLHVLPTQGTEGIVAQGRCCSAGEGEMLLGTSAKLFSYSHPWHTSQFTLGMLVGARKGGRSAQEGSQHQCKHCPRGMSTQICSSRSQLSNALKISSNGAVSGQISHPKGSRVQFRLGGRLV